MKHWFGALSAALLLGVASFAMAAEPKPLIPNGDFQLDRNGDGSPEGWKAADHVLFVTEEGGNRFMRLKSPEPGKNVMQYLMVSVPSDAKALELTFKVRYENIKPGEKSWFDGRIMFNFLDADKKKIGGAGAPYFRGTSKGWQEKSAKFAVPDGAVTLEIMPTLFQAKSGTLDLDDLKLVAIDPSTLPKKVDMTSPIVAAPVADKLPRELHVVGNHLETADGKGVWLQGLSLDSMQWNPAGENIVKSIGVAIEQWKANCIRLAVTEEKWFGRHELQNDGGAGYRQVIDSAVNAATGRGAYLVIDLHRFRAPTEEHARFWKEVAEKYKNHPGVMFELFNEPHGISWEIWRDGGEVSDKPKAKADVVAENNEKLTSFKAVGMQPLVDLVRATGAKNIVIVGGLDWSYDISGVLKGFALEDKAGNGIMYSSHVYPWKSKWQEKFLVVAEKHPLFIGEVGCPEKWSDFSFIPPSQQREKLGPGCTWPADMIGTIQKHKLNWTGFSFHPRCGPMVIKDWDYTPTDYWGVYVKQALAGKVFEVQKLR